MRKLLFVVAGFGIATAPAIGQTTSQPQGVPAAEPKMVTKTVCERVKDDTTGSRLGSSKKVCRKVQVPADTNAQTPKRNGHSAHNG